MSGIPSLPNSGLKTPNTKAKFVLIGIGVVGLGLAIYFGTALITPKGTQTTVNAAGQTTSTVGGAPEPSGTTATTPPPSVCTSAQKDILATNATISVWSSGINSWIQSTQATLTATPTAPPTPAITAKKTEIMGVKTCLDDLYQNVQGAATTLATLRGTQQTKQKTIEERKLDLQIAKDRALLAVNPDYNRSYYDGWFPMNRPLRQQTIPILIGFSLFFVCMSFLSILSFLRMDVRLLIPQLNTGSGTPLKQQAKSPLFMGTLILLLTVTGLMIWAFARGS